MKFVIVTSLLLLFAYPAFGAVDLFKAFDERIGGDLDEASRIEAQMKSGVRAGCPELKTPDMSSCFKAQVGRIQVKSAAQLAVLIKAGVNASLYDHGKGYGVEMVKLLLADNMLMALEKVDTSKFYVNEFASRSAKDKEAQVLMHNEEVALRKLFEESLPVIKEAAGARAPIKAADVAARWRTEAALVLKNRLSKLSADQFKFENQRP